MHQRWRDVASAFHRSGSILKTCSFTRFPRWALKWLSITLAVATVVPVVLLSTRRPPAHAVATSSELIRSLPFTLVTEGDRLSLDWNRESPAIQAAECGVLWIADGGIHRRLVLDASQLRTGKLFYWPVNKDVSFQLTMAEGQMDCGKQSAAPLQTAQVPADRNEPGDRPALRNRRCGARRC